MQYSVVTGQGRRPQGVTFCSRFGERLGLVREIGSLGRQRHTYRANDRRRIRGIVQHIKGRDQIEPTLREIDSIDCLEGHSIGQPLSLGVRTGALDRRKMRIEAAAWPESTFARAGDLRSVGLKASVSETSNGELAHELGELHTVVGSQHLRRLLTNHDRGCVRVAGDDVRHDARVSHAQPRDPHHP